ncbi:hypothetical protein ACH5RR_034034 [Cinchona calisaya]|uniref:Protein kinase domain-containing protein n=1 Tax=Cinchona calisaya TaxID=153742 RepID=A0ABD2Y9P8_9GENT
MARVYDNWDRLVRATLRREDLRRSGQRTPSDLSLASFSLSSSFSFNSSFSSFKFSTLLLVGDSFSYHQILKATDYLSSSNLIKHGHSGDIFYGVLDDGTQVAVKKVGVSSVEKELYLKTELGTFGKVSHSRLVPLLGHCLENGYEKFVVYKYMPNKDLSSSLFTQTGFYKDYEVKSLDWSTRLRIAIGAAEGLCYLHHECFPPLVHRDIQASSILLDDNFGVRLGSLSEVCTAEETEGSQNKTTSQNRISRFLRLPKRYGVYGQGTSGTPNAMCAYDVYCLGRVLLELVTGKLGFSAARESSTSMKDWMKSTLLYIKNIYDMKLVGRIVDPSLMIDEDRWMEVWAVAFIAKACLNSEPLMRPQMAYVLEALKNSSKVSEESALSVGLGKKVDVLDTLGSNMINLNQGVAFSSGTKMKGYKISILAFEVANTIGKGANIMNFLSKENIRHLKEVVLPSESVQHLISKDMDELLRIAATDEREELQLFSQEVVRFGNLCKDPQWHNLNRNILFQSDNLDRHILFHTVLFTRHKQFKEEAELVMQQLMTLVQITTELYHELRALDTFEDDKRKAQEDGNSNPTQSDFSLELKSQIKLVRSLKKKSLWYKNLDEVMGKLVHIVYFLHLEILAAFSTADRYKPIKNSHQRLGSAGLALHYADIITQIDIAVTKSNSMPPKTRDTLYQGLPPSIKLVLPSKLRRFQLREELTIEQIKTEMEKTLCWLVPMATNTTKAHHRFGWVSEWADAGSKMNQRTGGQADLLRIETLHHADKEKTEAYILDLVVWLHHLVSQSTARIGSIRIPRLEAIRLTSHKPKFPSPTLTIEDQEMLLDVSKRKLTPGISRSQEFYTAKTRLSKHDRLSKSWSHSSTGEKKGPFSFGRTFVPVIDFGIDRMKALDFIDRVDSGHAPY